MSKLLLLSRYVHTTQKMVKILENMGYTITSCYDNQGAARQLQKNAFDVFVIGAGVDKDSRKQMRELAQEYQNNCKIVDGQPFEDYLQEVLG